MAQTLLEQGISFCQSTLKKYPRLGAMFRKHYNETVLANLHGFDNKGKPLSQLTREDSLLMGRKLCLVKFCANAICIDSFGRILNKREEAGFDDLCAGIQLIDDLSDWQEDYRCGHYTYPLQKGLQWIENRRQAEHKVRVHLTDDEVMAMIILSGAVTDIVCLIRENISSAIDHLSIDTTSYSGRYFIALMNWSWRVKNHIESLVLQRPEVSQALAGAIGWEQDIFTDVVSRPEYSIIWGELKALFADLARVSN